MGRKGRSRRSPEALLRDGDRLGAVAGFRRGAAAGQVDAMFQLGTLLAEDGDPEGLRWLRKAHEAKPGEGAIRNNLGHALREAGALEEARALFEGAVRVRPRDAAALYGLSTVLVSAGAHAEAEAVLRRAVAAAPGFALAVRQHGDVLEALGRTSEAMEAFHRALALQPRDAQVLRKLGLMYAFVGRRPLATAMLRQSLALRPGDPLAAHMLGALSGEGSDRPDDGYVRELFDAFAESFDTQLQDVLRYRVPDRIAEVLGPGSLGRVLDLGCGTGLLAPRVAGRTDHLVGVDLSPRMLAKARARGGYDTLHAEGLVDFLDRAEARFDVVVAADVFVYVGVLDDVFAGVRACCDGRFVFTTELADEGLELRPSGRYAHGQDLVDLLAERHGFTLAYRSVEALRTEAERPIMGQLVVLDVASKG